MTKQESFIEGGLEHLENEINEFLGSKREDQFSTPLLESVQKKSSFSCLLRHSDCRGPRTLQNFQQKCQKIAGCCECAI